MTTIESLQFQDKLKPTKNKIQDSIFCVHHKGDSGWTNDEIAKIPTDVQRELKCTNCGEVCVRIIPRGLEVVVSRTIKPYIHKI